RAARKNPRWGRHEFHEFTRIPNSVPQFVAIRVSRVLIMRNFTFLGDFRPRCRHKRFLGFTLFFLCTAMGGLGPQPCRVLGAPGRFKKLDRARSSGRSTFGGAARLEKMRAVSVITPLRPGTGRGRALERERAWEGESP